ncbi:AAA family ATPase [Methylophilus sp. 5]|uniref:AAA family ATPase n=1 Tax=Methylophilus sp. 5 TaxID=1112274 RepID=UPI00048B56F5|nr:AAA family ATPase [Methylophilus sp. 5]
MRVRAIYTEKGPFPDSFVLQEKLDNQSNWITVLIGQNGSRKSLLLRLICDAALKRKSYYSHGHTTLKIGLESSNGSPRKVIALSGTPLDRFPRGGADELTNYKSIYDELPYFYFGQRASNGMVGTNQSLRNLGRVYLKYSSQLIHKSKPLNAIFAHLGLSSTLGFKFRRNRKIEIIKDGKRVFSIDAFRKRLEEITKTLTNLERPTSQSQAEISTLLDFLNTDSEFRKEFIETLKSLDANTVELTLSADNFQLYPGKYKFETSIWRYALWTGIVEIDGLTFYKRPNTNQNNSQVVGEIYTESDLSSGQWNWLSSLVGLTLELEDNSLVLIDEPENSLHPNWQRDYISMLVTALESQNKCHAIIATHSAFIASGISDSIGNIISLTADPLELSKTGNVVNPKPIEIGYGWNSNDVYQDIFGMDSTRAPDLIQKANYALGLIREGISSNSKELMPLAVELFNEAQNLPVHDSMRNVLESILTAVKDVNKNDNK